MQTTPAARLRAALPLLLLLLLWRRLRGGLAAPCRLQQGLQRLRCILLGRQLDGCQQRRGASRVLLAHQQQAVAWLQAQRREQPCEGG